MKNEQDNAAILENQELENQEIAGTQETEVQTVKIRIGKHVYDMQVIQNELNRASSLAGRIKSKVPDDLKKEVTELGGETVSYIPPSIALRLPGRGVCSKGEAKRIRALSLIAEGMALLSSSAKEE